MRTCGVHPLTKPETSRFPRKELPHMPGSSTTPGRADARDDTSVCVAFRDSEHVGTRDYLVYAAQWLAYALPCRRFAVTLAGANARLGADADRYSFTVVDLHHQLFAGFTGAPEFKARVAMTALSGEKTLAELSAEFGIHPTMISGWKQELVKRAGELFARSNRAPAIGDAQKVIDDLHRKIGQLQVERDFLAGQPAIFRLLRGGR